MTAPNSEPALKRGLSKGGKLWCAICLTANLAAYALNLTLAIMERGPMALLVTFAAASFIAAIGFLILLCGRKEGFYIVCAAAITAFAVNMFAINIPAMALGIVNPLITWLIIKSSWTRLNLPGPRPRLKSRTVALVLAIVPPTALFGIDRFYLGYIWTGFLKFITCGGCLVWYVLDIIHIANGKLTDKYGRPLRKAEHIPEQTTAKGQKGFAITNIVMGVILAIAGFAMFSDPSVGPGGIIAVAIGIALWVIGAKALNTLKRYAEDQVRVGKICRVNKICFIISCVILAVCTILPVIMSLL